MIPGTRTRELHESYGGPALTRTGRKWTRVLRSDYRRRGPQRE